MIRLVMRNLYRLTLRRGSIRNAAPHPGETIEDVGLGDYYRYPGDGPHSYENAAILLAMESSRQIGLRKSVSQTSATNATVLQLNFST